MEGNSNSSIMNSTKQYPINHCAVLIIAAGESKRMGSPKQLLVVEGETLINRIIKIAKKAVNFPTYVILGASAETIHGQLPNIDIHVVQNAHWQEGMASSIRLGLNTAVAQNPNLEGVLIVVCDQPYITESTISDLLQLQKEKDTPMAAAYYNQVMGTPALFHQSIFNDILSLKGDMGAKRIIQSRPEEVAKLHFEKGLLDIDTKEDYQALLKEINNND